MEERSGFVREQLCFRDELCVSRGGSCGGCVRGARWRRRGARWWRRWHNKRATHPSSRATSRATSRPTSCAASSTARRKRTRRCIRRRRELVEQREHLVAFKDAGLESCRSRPNDEGCRARVVSFPTKRWSWTRQDGA